MKPLTQLALAFAITLQAHATPPPDAGGRDVSVALFSTHTLHAVTITPIGPNAWTTRCPHCPHQPLKAPLHLAGTFDLLAGGTFRIADDASHEERTATGLWHLRASPRTPEIDIVLTLPSERYVAAVLSAETAPDGPAQSLRALAILARTYALNSEHYAAQPGHLPADLCDSTQCQAMRLGPVAQAIEDAVRDTAGETLWSRSQRAEVFFSQDCGGTTEDAASAWPNLRGLSYLRSHPDPFCDRRDKAAWHAEVALPQLAQIARQEAWHLPARIVAVQVAGRSPSRRALRLVFAGDDGQTASLSASALRFGVGRSLGWNQVRSDLYELHLRNDALVFDGRGHGHGVGLCQTGATEMGLEGKSYRDILAFYFPGTNVRVLSSDNGWQQTQSGELTLKSTQPLPPALRSALEHAWIEAKRRFPPHRSTTPVVVFAPSTELFRQLTAQPGWALASTTGDTVVLQPQAVMRAHSDDISSVALHEMLHVLIETEVEAGPNHRAPFWLREGLVEALAGTDVHNPPALSASEIESALLHANSLPESQRAHLAAGSKVRALLDRFGLSTIRSWLTSGLPEDVSSWAHFPDFLAFQLLSCFVVPEENLRLFFFHTHTNHVPCSSGFIA